MWYSVDHLLLILGLLCNHICSTIQIHPHRNPTFFSETYTFKFQNLYGVFGACVEWRTSVEKPSSERAPIVPCRRNKPFCTETATTPWLCHPLLSFTLSKISDEAAGRIEGIFHKEPPFLVGMKGAGES